MLAGAGEVRTISRARDLTEPLGAAADRANGVADAWAAPAGLP